MLIWHYTSTNILNEFLKDDAKLYATHIAFLNDTHEGIFSDSLLKKYIESLLAYADNDEFTDNEINQRIKKGDFFSRFVTSFSKVGDELPLWRGYAQNGGFSIGFDRAELKKYLIKPNDDSIEYKITDCIYNLDKQQELTEKIEDLANTIKSHKEAVIEDYRIQQEIDGIIQNLMYIKHKSFSYEKEVRLLACKKNGSALEAVEIIGNKPRIEVKFKNDKIIRDFIREIKVSPHGNVEQNRLLAEILVVRYGLESRISISDSNIPYRLI